MSQFATLSLVAVVAVATGCLSTDPARVAEEVRTARRDASAAVAPSQSDEGGVSMAGRSDAPRKFDGELGLRDAVNLALECNLSLRTAFLRRGEARGAIQEARGEALPDLRLAAAANSDLAERDETPESYAVTARLTQPLWRSGIVAAGLRYARLHAASTDAAIREHVQSTIAAVTRLYLEVLLQGHLVAVYEEAVGVAERMLRTSGSKRDVGTASDYEVLRAEVEVSTARADLLKARNTLQTARLELLRTLGVAQDSTVVLTDTLTFETEGYDLATAVRMALEHRPDLFQAEAAVRMADANVAAVRGLYGPGADAFVAAQYANPDPNRRSGVEDRDAWGDDWTVGASMYWTLFDGFERRGRLLQAVSKREQAQAALRDAEEAARVEVAKALLDLGHSAELYASQRKNIELAREALRMLESGFRMGRNTQVEVLDAQSALTDAVGRYHNSVFLHSVARLNVRHALGLLGPDALEPVQPDYRIATAPLAPVSP